jgi:peptide/nickel transport system permease protein
MSLRGVDTSIDHDDVYEKIYKELNLDLPNFYFTIQPSHFPKTINQIFETNKKDLYQKLLRSGYAYNDIDQAINNFSHKLDAAKASNNADEIIELNKVYNLEFPEQHKSLADLKSKKSKSFFWPSFHLNGFKNQYHKWLQTIFTNGFGISILDGKTAVQKVKKALTWTLSITLIDFLLSLFFGIFIGTYLAANENGRWQKILSQVLYFLYSIPVFWFATIMVVYFTTDDYGWWTDWFPSVAIDIYLGKSTIQQIVMNAEKLILPIIILTLHSLAYTTRLVRRSVLDELDKPYASLAYSMGLKKTEVIRKHILKNALIPIITSMASAFANAFAGSLVLEVIFNIPGMGRLLVSSMASADWNVVFCITLLLSFVTIVSFVIADVLYAYVNPKIELNAKN